MPYTADKPQLPETSDQLRARIPGWGADLDPKDRPSVPHERFDPGATGAHWTFPDRQPETSPREMSVEHSQLPPVFGTTAPLRGISGTVRRYAYRRFSEARAAHWLLLVAADRLDAAESHLEALLRKEPDNPLTETGILSEDLATVRERFRGHRVDRPHHWMDPLVVAAPWLVGAGIAATVLRAVARART